MQTITVVIKDPMGLHARPAGLLVKEARKYSSKILLRKGDKAVEATRLMALMSMGIQCGDTISVTMEGPDEEAAARELASFFEENGRFRLRCIP